MPASPFFSHLQSPLLWAALFSQANHADMQCTGTGTLLVSAISLLHRSIAKKKSLIKLSGVIHGFYSMKFSQNSLLHSECVVTIWKIFSTANRRWHFQMTFPPPSHTHRHKHTQPPRPRWRQHSVQDWSVLVDASSAQEDKNACCHGNLCSFFHGNHNIPAACQTFAMAQLSIYGSWHCAGPSGSPPFQRFQSNTQCKNLNDSQQQRVFAFLFYI